MSQDEVPYIRSGIPRPKLGMQAVYEDQHGIAEHLVNNVRRTPKPQTAVHAWFGVLGAVKVKTIRDRNGLALWAGDVDLGAVLARFTQEELDASAEPADPR